MREKRTSLVAQMVKILPAVQETWVQSLGWEDSLRRERPPTPVFLPGEFHGQRSLAGYSPWGHKELDMTEQLTLSLFSFLVNQISMRPVIRYIFEEVVRYVMEVGHLRRW